MHDKQQISQHLKTSRCTMLSINLQDKKSQYTYINEHLPKKFQEQKKLLLPAYRDKKQKGNKNKKVIGKSINCNNTLWVDNVIVELPSC